MMVSNISIFDMEAAQAIVILGIEGRLVEVAGSRFVLEADDARTHANNQTYFMQTSHKLHAAFVRRAINVSFGPSTSSPDIASQACRSFIDS